MPECFSLVFFFWKIFCIYFPVVIYTVVMLIMWVTLKRTVFSDFTRRSVDVWLPDRCCLVSCQYFDNTTYRENHDKLQHLPLRLNRIPPETDNYIRFIKFIKTAATKSIPKGHGKWNTPRWTEECNKLLHEYEISGSEDTASRLIILLNEKIRKRWITTMEEISYTHFNRKSWALLRKLGAVQPIQKESVVSANDVASILFKTSNIKPSKYEKIEIKKIFTTALGECVGRSFCMEDFVEGEVSIEIGEK